MKLQDETRKSAEEKLQKKMKQRAEAEKAVAEYEAARRAVDEKSARLKAIRLARDAEPSPPKTAKPKRNPRKTPI